MATWQSTQRNWYRVFRDFLPNFLGNRTGKQEIVRRRDAKQRVENFEHAKAIPLCRVRLRGLLGEMFAKDSCFEIFRSTLMSYEKLFMADKGLRSFVKLKVFYCISNNQADSYWLATLCVCLMFHA